MPTTLLRDNLTRPQARILTSPSWGSSTATSGGVWTILPMQAAGQRKHGFELLDCDRGTLPFAGRARFKLEYGRFSDGLIGADSTTVRPGTAWDPSTDSLDITDLRGYEIRIQLRADDSDTWRTVWWGRCETQEDKAAPGAAIPMGTRIYHCVDGLQRANLWRMSRHGYRDGSTTMTNCRGAVGYNVPAEHDAIYSKNRSSTTFTTEGGTSAYCHTAAGRGDGYWTAQQACDNALAVARPAGEPLLNFQTAADPLLLGVHCWDVKETDTAFGVLNDICRRERGRGCVFLDWTESDPTGALTVFLQVTPQLISDVTYTDPT